MALGGVWHRTLVYFGLADEDEDYYEDEAPAPPTPDIESTYRERATVRKIDRNQRRRSSSDFDDIYSDEDTYAPRRGAARDSRDVRDSRDTRDLRDSRDTRDLRESRDIRDSRDPYQRQAVIRPLPSAEVAPVRVHLVLPKNFNDAQVIADKFKSDIPVILNLQTSETDLAKRLIDFASGLTYALDGGMQRVADKVFLLTPKNVEVSAEERQRLVEKGFFNQS